MIYCDTSVLVAGLAAEANSAVVQTWLGDHKRVIATSAWVGTELSNALVMKRRLNIIDDADLVRIRSAWHALHAQLFPLSIIEQDFTAASTLIERPNLVLRSGDALHLAIAMRHEFSLATLDKKFAEAARTMMVDVTEVSQTA